MLLPALSDLQSWGLPVHWFIIKTSLGIGQGVIGEAERFCFLVIVFIVTTGLGLWEESQH